MRISRRRFLVGAAALATLPALPAVATTRSGRRPKYVILIDWDGFDTEFVERAATPNLDALASRGSISVAESTFQTISNSARASMSTGSYPEVHGNVAYYYDRDLDRAVGQTRFLAAETIAQALASAGKTLASVQWYMVQNYGAVYGDPEHLYVQPGGPFESRVNVAIDILNRRPVDSGGQTVTVPKIPDFMAVYGSDFDALAHDEGAESPNIGPLLAEMDRQLGRLVQATKDVGIYGETAFILACDHGMGTWNRTLIPDVLAAISAAGYVPEIVTPGRSAAPRTEVVIVPNAVRTGQLTLRGRAATPEGHAQVRAALEELPQIARTFDRADLAAMRASEKIGDLVAEAQVPWGFALSTPDDGTARASHGSTEELPVPLLLSGAGIRRGVPPRDASLVDVAPTIAYLLGVRPPAQGRALTESLGTPARGK